MRIVSLVPSHTESLHDLGLADSVVGRTRFCIHPAPWVDGIPSVGGTKDAKLERIVELEPDLVVADKDENPKALIEAIEAAGIDVVWSEIDTLSDAADFLEVLGQRCGVEDAAHEAAAAIRNIPPPDGLPVTAFVPIWYQPWMTFDASAYPHAVLAAAGIENVFGDHEGPKYFEVGPEEVAAAAPNYCLLPTEPFPFHKQAQRIDTAGLGACGEATRRHVIDGEALTWFGTRTVRGVAELRRAADALR